MVKYEASYEAETIMTESYCLRMQDSTSDIQEWWGLLYITISERMHLCIPFLSVCSACSHLWRHHKSKPIWTGDRLQPYHISRGQELLLCNLSDVKCTDTWRVSGFQPSGYLGAHLLITLATIEDFIITVCQPCLPSGKWSRKTNLDIANNTRLQL